MPRTARLMQVLLTLGLLLAVALPARAVPPSTRPAAAAPKVAIIVGPTGPVITPQYLELAELAAAAAERGGATVARAYSPDATPERVLAAVAGANIVVYFGHGTGFPNPYSEVAHPDSINGWALQGPKANGSHADGLADGTMRYYGESWLLANARPAPGFVMIYSNACYAPGASEGGLPPPSQEEALAHVANYSRPAFALGASAYFATDFFGGAATLIDALLAPPSASYGDIFKADPQFEASALTVLAHPSVTKAQVWLHRSAYFGGKLDYWYAFAGWPDRAFGASAPEGQVAGGTSLGARPPAVVGEASSYPFTRGMEGQPTVALPIALGGKATLSVNGWVAVCGDRCAVLPIVDSCPCYWGTPDQRVINLSHSAWQLISDAPLAEGLIPVRLYLGGKIPSGEAPSPSLLRTAVLAPTNQTAP
ncbi:MAG TPA: hypothetical protein VF013_09690 [Candidatus Limnocylindria bacterium]